MVRLRAKSAWRLATFVTWTTARGSGSCQQGASAPPVSAAEDGDESAVIGGIGAGPGGSAGCRLRAGRGDPAGRSDGNAGRDPAQRRVVVSDPAVVNDAAVAEGAPVTVSRRAGTGRDSLRAEFCPSAFAGAAGGRDERRCGPGAAAADTP
jgi:hypothetical protein